MVILKREKAVWMGRLLLRQPLVAILSFLGTAEHRMCKCSLPARVRASPTFVACGGFVLQPSPERPVGKLFYFCKGSGTMLREHLPFKCSTKNNEGLFGFQWPYFVSETLLHCCSTQLKGLTNVFCLKYCTEVILYMCICIVFWMYLSLDQNWVQFEFSCLFETFPSHLPQILLFCLLSFVPPLFFYSWEM